ncbi:MAG: protein kinase domain-containing protein, partial [Clostridium sp.]
MKRYMCSLKQERLNKQQISFKDIKILFEFLIQTLNSIHNREIIHRDIKPENILVDKEGNYFLADFGIAHFTEGIYPIANKTKENERLANFEFSAPEQINSKFKCVPATDIYSMAQVLYWFVFNHVHKGTGIKNLSNVFKEKEA